MAQQKDPRLNMDGPPFVCPDCLDAGKSQKEAEFPSYQARYHHRRNVHHVKPAKPGQWSAQRKRNGKRKVSNSLVKVETNALRNGHSTQETVIARAQADGENAVNFVTGRCQQIIESFAAEFGIPASVLASGVASILHSQASRSIHRTGYHVPSMRRQTA